ncbi:MAG: S41 family peptidase [Caulobacterales bacterium]
MAGRLKVLLFTVAAAGMIGVGAAAWSARPDANAQQAETFRQLELFADVLARVHADYVTDVDDKEMMEAAVNGMLASLDPHSSYMNADAFRDMQVQTRGEYGGLGIEVTMEDGVVRVVAPIDGTPASRVGLQPGDFITAINGESIVGYTLNDAVDKMRGQIGTAIKLTIAREGKDPFDVDITRENIVVKPVRYRMEGGDVGYIRISQFTEKAGSGVEEAIKALRKQGGSKMRGIIVDMRNNPGGLLDQAVDVSDAFLDGGEVVSTRGRDPLDIERYNARRGDDAVGLPVVVLINEGSASASEIVAGALQDRARAKIVGIRSFGKGSVQTVIPIKGGRQGALRLTTARYFTPSGRSIQGEGVDPDVMVLATRNPKIKGTTFSEKDLPHALTNDFGPAAKTGEKEKPKTNLGPVDQPPEGWNEKDDYQLKRAMDILRQSAVASTKQKKAG